MISLSALELELLRCAATAHKVHRPDADLNVGDEVTVSFSHSRRAGIRATVTAIGRTWITVSGVQYKFRRDTMRSAHGSGTEDVLKTLDQQDYDDRLRTARARLLDGGVNVGNARDLPDGRVLAFAALLDVMDEASGRDIPRDTAKGA